MWARVCEFMIACWLMMSPFIFGHTKDDYLYWVTDLGAASAIMVLSMISYWSRMKHAHLAIAVIGLVVAAVGRFTDPSHVPPAGQNEILTGLLLLMFAIVPNHAGQPTPHWRPESELQ